MTLTCPTHDAVALTQANYPGTDVLASLEQRTERLAQLFRAATAHSLNIANTFVCLEMQDYCIRLKAEISAVSSTFIQLHGGAYIPTHRIIRVEFEAE